MEDKVSVVYRPKSLVIGIGLHQNTSKETIRGGIDACLDRFKLSEKSITGMASIKKPQDVKGLIDLGREMGLVVRHVDREELAEITAPNPSETVNGI